MSRRKGDVCPVGLAGGLDNRVRRWVQDPRKILGPYIQEGMTVLDLGCGPGFFTLEMALLAGEKGRVIAADLQEGMLRKVREKIKGTGLEGRITLHRSGERKIGISEQVDFILLFYMVHEVPDKEAFFHEIGTILREEGEVLIVEPPIHVTRSAFAKTVRIAREEGFTDREGPGLLFSKSVILKKVR